ncbi:MAG: MFS transporter [Rhodospirillales bacterium]|nr:MFS transporter [Rhodospirillales bacterium]
MGGESHSLVFRLGLLVSSHVVGTINIVTVLAIAPLIKDDLSLSATQFGFFVTAYYSAQAIWSIPAGGIVDRFGVGRSLIACHVLMALSAVLLAIANSFELCIVALFLMGIGYSMVNPATGRGVLAWYPSERRGTAMGIKQFGVPLGGVFAAGNGALATLVDWQSLMWGIAGVILFNGILCFYLLLFFKPRTEDRPSMMANIRTVMKDTNVNIFALSGGLINTGQTNFFAFLTLFLRDVAGASQPMAGFAMGLAQTTSAVARLGWGAIGDKFFLGRRKVLMAWICGSAALLLVMMVWVGPGWGLWYGLGLVGLLGITIASFAPVAQAISAEMVIPELAGSAMGYNMTGVHIGSMVAPPIFGAVVDWSGGYAGGWLVTALFVALGTGLMVFKFREGIQKQRN